MPYPQPNAADAASARAGFSESASPGSARLAGAESPADTLRVRAVDDAGNVRPLTEIEADVIRLAMIQHRGRVSEVARRLGIGRSTLYRKLREHNIDPETLLS